jgi:hypothetical protein
VRALYFYVAHEVLVEMPSLVACLLDAEGAGRNAIFSFSSDSRPRSFRELFLCQRCLQIEVVLFIVRHLDGGGFNYHDPYDL